MREEPPMIRRTPLRAAALLGSALIACGCHGEPSAAPPLSTSAPSASGAASARVGDSPLAVARRLALAKPDGSLPVDREIARLQGVLEKRPTSHDTWTLLGRSWVRKARESSFPGFYLSAQAAADVALDIAPEDRAAKNLVAIVLLNQHKFDEARDVAEQILQKQPMDLMALGTKSDAFLEVGRYAEATAAAQKMMDVKPNLPSYIRASYLAWLRGDDAAALENARLAADAGKDPRDPEPRCWALVQAAMIFFHRGDTSGADAGASLVLKECSDYPPALVVRGRVAMAKGEFARAAELFGAAHKLSPLVETAWLLGDARAANGDRAGAEEAYALVVKHGRQVDPRTLALFYAVEDRDHDEAVRLASEEKKARDDIYTEDALAWALYRKGRLEEARAASDKANSLGTKDPRLIYHRGAIRVAAGEREAGEKLVEEALALSPKFGWRESAEAQKLVEGRRR